jgi:hypothetical protein
MLVSRSTLNSRKETHFTEVSFNHNFSVHISVPMVDSEFWSNITDYLDCSANQPTETNWTLDETFNVDSVEITEIRGNGTFCLANSTFNHFEESSRFSCSIVNHPDVEKCRKTEGSQSTTFWVYLAIRSVFQVSSNIFHKKSNK